MLRPAHSGGTGSGLSRLKWSGAGMITGCLLYFVLLQSSTLWSRPVEFGYPLNSFRLLFPPEWLAANRATGLGLLNSALYVVILAGMFAIYWLALRRLFRSGSFGTGEERGAFQLILGCTVSALFVLLWVPGTLSADLHSYIWYGRIWAIFGDNPFLHTPAEYLLRDPGRWLNTVYWQDTPSVYGPVWVWLAGAVAWPAHALGDGITLHIMGHKLLATFAHLANVVLLWRVSACLVERYERGAYSVPHFVADAPQPAGARVAITLTYAWNPLLLIEFGANSHNDVLMLTGVLAALLLHFTGRWRWAVVALTLACLVKVAALFFLVPYLLRAPVPNSRFVGARYQMAGLALATGVICYLPFWQGTQVLAPLWGGPSATLFVNSLAAMLRYNGPEWIHHLTGHDAEVMRVNFEVVLRWVALLIMSAAAVVLVPRMRSFRSMINGWGWLIFVYLTLGALWFWPWYVSWLVLPVALAGNRRLFTATQVLCFTSMALYAIYPQLPDSLYDLVYYRSLIIIAPSLVYVCASWWWARRASTPARDVSALSITSDSGRTPIRHTP